MNDESWVIDAILKGTEKDRKDAIGYLYDKCYSSFSKLVKKRGTEEQAEDLFQDGLSVMYNNLISGVFRQQSRLSTYLISICKNRWLMELRSQKESVELDEIAASIDEEELRIDIKALKLLQQVLNTDCQAILKAFYYDSKTMNFVDAA